MSISAWIKKRKDFKKRDLIIHTVYSNKVMHPLTSLQERTLYIKLNKLAYKEILNYNGR